MRSVVDGQTAPDPSYAQVDCAVCGLPITLATAYSVAVVYVGTDQHGRVRYSECDADQPFACSQEHALQAAHNYHTANHRAKRVAWEQSEPTHAPIVSRLPAETACHWCGAARTPEHVEVLVDYRLTASSGIAPWHCPHLACPTCLPGIVQACAKEHLGPRFQRALEAGD